MASLRKKPNSAFWIACFKDQDGRKLQRSTGVADEGDPKARARARVSALEVAQNFERAARGELTEARIRKTMTELFDRVNPRRLEHLKTYTFLNEWVAVAKRQKAVKTSEKYEGVVRAFFVHLGPRAQEPLDQIGIKDAQSFVTAQIEAGKSASSVRTDTKVLSIPFTRAMKHGYILTNPMAGVELPAGAGESREPFTPNEVKKLVAEAPPDWKTVILLGFYTGARLGDCISFRWSNFDLESKLIRYRPGKTRSTGKTLTVPLHPALEAHLSTLPGSDEPQAPLCPGLSATPISGRSGLSRKFGELMARAGVGSEVVEGGSSSRQRAFNRRSFHSLRHTFTSILANANVPQELRMTLTGHSSEAMNRQYTHHEMLRIRQAVINLPSI